MINVLGKVSRLCLRVAVFVTAFCHPLHALEGDPQRPARPSIELIEQKKVGDPDIQPEDTKLSASTLPHLGELRIFPGAQGFGTLSPGGRGGTVCKVTNLHSTGKGSLRDCVERSGPRMVIFEVGGTIVLDDALKIDNPFISIYGQTAPGDGILVRMSLESKETPLRVRTHDVLVQHLRLRAGSSSLSTCCRDGAGVGGSGKDVYNVVLDHNSISWGTDQIAHTWYAVHDVTFSRNIISESLHDNGSNDEGPAGRGLIIGSAGSHSISLHKNLIAHSYQRNPLVKTSGVVDVTSNLIYHWVSRGGQQHSEYPGMKVNWVKNKWIALLNLQESSQNSAIGWGDIHLLKKSADVKAYFEGNLGHNRPDHSLPEWSIANTHWGEPYDPSLGYHSNVRFPAPEVDEISADRLEDELLPDVGATLPKRDSVDQRVVMQVKTRTGKMPNCVGIDDKPDSRCKNNVGGWPAMQGGTVATDTDNDGIPDNWEIKWNLNPNVADSHLDSNGDGYSNLESWIHEARD